jgi:hypothetical protein
LVVFPCAGHTSSMHQPGERGERMSSAAQRRSSTTQTVTSGDCTIARRASSRHENALGPGLSGWSRPSESSR